MSDAHGHPDKPFLQHHFEDEEHQFDAGKLGIWAFLVTEVLFFSGLFCAYAIYRGMHPEVFTYASRALDTKWGAINTCVLLFSSLTAAWAVRNAQLGQKKLLVANLALTIACAFGFMGIKYVEYTHKFHLNIYPGVEASEYLEGSFPAPKAEKVAYDVGVQAGAGEAAEGDHAEGDHADGDHGDDHALVKWNDPNIDPRVKDRLKTFFGIYYCMTGLHGIHVQIGRAHV